jgi:glucoamylase
MKWLRAVVGLVLLLAIGGTLVSGGSQADLIRYRYLPGNNELRAIDRYGTARDSRVDSLGDPDAVRADPLWLEAARPLGAGAPSWAKRMYRRSLLVLRGLTDLRTGVVVAGARDGWEYVWPRDASAVALALNAAGFRAEARRIVHFLLGLDLGAAARFHPDATPVGGRSAQGDAAGWVAAAARVVNLPNPKRRLEWMESADYQEKSAGDYLGNAIASGVGAAHIRRLFATQRGLQRRASDPSSGLDSAAAWAVRPFPHPALFPLVRRSLLGMLHRRESRFGIVPSEDWPGMDPWTAPTAWSAWSLATLGERHAALHLMAELRRASTPAGLLPERVDARTGVPRSTTPLAWSHAFAILALRQLWPNRRGR